VQRAGSPRSRDRGPSSRLTSGKGAFPGVPERDFDRVGLERGRLRLGTPSVGLNSSLATRADEFHASTIRGCLAHLTPVRVLRCSSPRQGLSCRLTLPRQVVARLSAHPSLNGEDASHRLLQLHDSRHEHLLERSDSRGADDAFTPSTRPLEQKPHRTTRVAALFDVALPASASSTTRPSSSDEGAGAGCSWWHPRSRDPSDGAPSRRRFRPRARRKNEPLTLPVATPEGRGPPPSPGPHPPPLRQKGWLPRPEAPSVDELPA